MNLKCTELKLWYLLGKKHTLKLDHCYHHKTQNEITHLLITVLKTSVYQQAW